jgi:hypothetical protein
MAVFIAESSIGQFAQILHPQNYTDLAKNELEFWFSRRIAKESRSEIFPFFEMMRRSPEKMDTIPDWSVPEFMEFISPVGIIVENHSEASELHAIRDGKYDTEQIRRQLQTRGGPIFDAFAHLSLDWSTPILKHYFEPSTKPADHVSVSVADKYELTFDKVNQRALLTKIVLLGKPRHADEHTASPIRSRSVADQ